VHHLLNLSIYLQQGIYHSDGGEYSEWVLIKSCFHNENGDAIAGYQLSVPKTCGKQESKVSSTHRWAIRSTSCLQSHPQEVRYDLGSALVIVILGVIGLPLSPLASPTSSSSLSGPMPNTSSRSSHTSLKLLWVGFCRPLGFERSGLGVMGI
jgi:hypothetical protein